MVDASENPIAGVRVTFAVTGGGGAVSPTTVETNAGGIAAATAWTLGGSAGTNTLTATVAGDGIAGNPATFTATGAVGSANKLVFVVQPSNTVVGGTITPAVQVQIQDASGNPVAAATNAITVSLGTPPNGATLNGTTTVNAINGVATLANLSVNKPGSGYKLTAFGSELKSAESAAFDIVAANSTTSIESITPSTSVVGQPYTVAVAVTPVPPASGVPTGTVTVSDGTGATCTLSAPASSCVLTSTSAGSKTITASYAGDANFGSSLDTEPHQVVKVPTTVEMLAHSPTSSVVGQPVTVSFVVRESGAGAPSGTVSVSDGAGATCQGDAPADSCVLTPTSAGTKKLTATYSGDEAFAPSTSPEVNHTVSPAATTTTITDDVPDPSVTGQLVTVRYQVSVNSPGGGAPTGNVTVTYAAGGGCTGTVAAGQCSFTPTGFGTNANLVATYQGSADYQGSTSPSATHTHAKANTTVAVASSVNPAAWGQAITFTATVTAAAPGTGIPDGTVQFKIDGADRGGAIALSNGTAQLIGIDDLLPGVHTVEAVYSGSTSYNGNTGTLTGGQSIHLIPTTTSLTANPSPSVFGQPVTLLATVSGDRADLLNGSVRFIASGTCESPAMVLGDATLSLRTASVVVSTLDAGSYTLRACYLGTPGVHAAGEAQVSHDVSQASTQTTVSTSGSSALNEPVTATVVVTAVAPGSGVPTGGVTVVADDGTSCTIPALSGGTGSCELTFPGSGTKTITATYAGGGNFAGSSGQTTHSVSSGS